MGAIPPRGEAGAADVVCATVAPVLACERRPPCGGLRQPPVSGDTFAISRRASVYGAMEADLIELLLRLMTTGSFVVGATAVYAALRNHGRQMNAQIFLAYSDRLQSIRTAMRGDLLALRRSTDLDPRGECELSAGAMETLHLVFELFELKERRYVNMHMWAVWRWDIDRLLNAPTIRLANEQIRREFEGHPRFIAWLNERQVQ